MIVGGRNGDTDPDDCTIGSVVTLRDVEILNLETNSIRAGKKEEDDLREMHQVCDLSNV